MAADRNYIKLSNAAHEEGGVLYRNHNGIPHTGPFAGMGREDVAATFDDSTTAGRRCLYAKKAPRLYLAPKKWPTQAVEDDVDDY